MKKSKIVATIGPATQESEVIKKIIENGASMFRFNMKYNTPEWHNSRIAMIRKHSKILKIRTGIIVDIPRSDFKLEINDFDFVALSYLKQASEVTNLKQRMRSMNRDVGIIAKIENERAIADLENIVRESDGVMVARGDLGIETPLKELAYFQKKIIDISRINNKPVIVATQMLLSMTKNNKPTRAEATDVANAVFDGTDALMLSEETALGEYPVEAVKTMAEIAEYNEKVGELRQITFKTTSLTDSLFAAAAKIVNESLDYKIEALVVFTKSGLSVRSMSKYRLGVPLIAISDQENVLQRLGLSYGVVPFYKKFLEREYKSIDPVFDEICSMHYIKKGGTIMIIHGSNWFETGSTNQISLRKI